MQIHLTFNFKLHNEKSYQLQEDRTSKYTNPIFHIFLRKAESYFKE